ncbi:hypothetical protein K438DRAFT_1909685 [Mycena galopus ATCC 62051]|nr:hypothetical protein K438DRAFT_1909685 [Mycena galopus ATCC 62051]
MPTVMSVTLAVGTQQLAKYKAFGVAGVTILCSDKTGTLTMNKLTILTYSSSADDVILLAVRAGIKLLDFKPFNPTDKRTEIMYRQEATGKLKRVTKGMTGSIIELCSRNRTEELEAKLEGYATRGLRALTVA